eukprot:scaffold5734_cov56-Phaeocystis_antarctica.AAC.1
MSMVLSDLVRVRVRVRVRVGVGVGVGVRVGVPWSCRTRAAGAARRASGARRSIGAPAATWAWATGAPK